MIVEPGERESEVADVSAGALDALAAAGRALADATSLAEALDEIVRCTAVATGADVVVARVAYDDSDAVARAVSAESAVLAAEIEGSRVSLAELPIDALDEFDELPLATRRLAERAQAHAVLLLPVRVGGVIAGAIELLRTARAFDEGERLLARLAADQISGAIRAFAPPAVSTVGAAEPLELAGEALAAGSADERSVDHVARLAVEATGAHACLVWRGEEDRAELVSSFGLATARDGVEAAADAARRALAGRRPVIVDQPGPLGAGVSVALQLGQPPVCVLQLLFARATPPADDELARLSTFAVRAAHTLRASERARTVSAELERTRSLLGVVAQANARLELSHALHTALESVAELLDAPRVGVYLQEEARLVSAAGRALGGPHAQVAERLLELALGPFRTRGMLVVEDAATDAGLAGLRTELEDTRIEAAVAVPLQVQEEVIGLLAVYPSRGRTLSASETALLAALASQVAVAVQNARLHERATRLGTELEDVLVLERQAAHQLRALYEISRSFAQSLSLETTLDAVARTIVDLLEVDAAVVGMPDERGDVLIARALHVADVRLADAVSAILARPQPVATVAARRLFRAAEPVILTPALARELGPPHELLVPFLEKGSTAVVLPIATPAEVLATLKLVSLDPERPITQETIDVAMSVAAQAALAIDNARLYQQQKEFSDTMQRSLLPRSRPSLAGLEVGEVYESSARVDVGGDVYDFMTLDDGRLAVVLGDVTGHGIDAAADMAMAKFVFRSLAREHPEPGEFLAFANDVVVGEIGPGKFITMLYLTIDPASGELACAAAGHPAPRLVFPDGSVRPVAVRGLALGIDSDQEYEEVREQLPVGTSVVVYTDGVIEARRSGELYGPERLDLVLGERRALPAKELAEAVLAECRAFGDGELVDDCAIVVIKRTG